MEKWGETRWGKINRGIERDSFVSMYLCDGDT